MTDVNAARRKLESLQIELAVVQETLAGPRARWRQTVNAISDAVISRDYNRQTIRSWKPLGRDNIKTLDDERARFLDDVGDLPDLERTLKAAVRTAEIEYRQAAKAAEQAAKAGSRNTQKPRHENVQMDLF